MEPPYACPISYRQHDSARHRPLVGGMLTLYNLATMLREIKNAQAELYGLETVRDPFFIED